MIYIIILPDFFSGNVLYFSSQTIANTSFSTLPHKRLAVSAFIVEYSKKLQKTEQNIVIFIVI